MAWSAFFPNNIFTFSPTQQASRLVSNYNIIRLIRIFKLKKKKERKKKRINGLFCCSCLLFFFFSLCLLVIVLSQFKISMIKKKGENRCCYQAIDAKGRHANSSPNLWWRGRTVGFQIWSPMRDDDL